MKRPEPASGFTLVEVMVAMSILSLVMLATVTGLRTLANTQAAIERKIARVDEVRTVSEFLRDLMESALVGSKGGLTLGGGGRDATYFRLNENGAEWKSTILFGEAFGGIYLVKVAAEDGQLVLRWQEPPRSGLAPKHWEDTESRTLVRDLEEFSVEVREEFHTDWTREWPEFSVAPALVRMQIKSADRYWPDLILQVQR
jgi:general secretion pathway protein J